MLCLEYIVWYGQFVTNWCDFIEIPFYSTIFVVTHGEIFGHLGHTGPLTVKTKWRCRRRIGGDCVVFLLLLKKITIVTKLRSRYYCNMSRIRLRLIRCHWSFDPRWVKISGNSEQLGPCGSTSHFVNNRHSRVKTRGASCIGGFGQTDGRRKFELGIPQSRGAAYIRGAPYIRDKTVYSMIMTNAGYSVMVL